MAMSTKVNFTAKGLKWKAYFLEEDAYVKVHGDTSEGITLKDKREVIFNLTHLTLELVKHEVFHAFKASCFTYVTDINAHDSEEIDCELFAHHDTEMTEKSKKIYNSLVNIGKK